MMSSRILLRVNGAASSLIRLRVAAATRNISSGSHLKVPRNSERLCNWLDHSVPSVQRVLPYRSQSTVSKALHCVANSKRQQDAPPERDIRVLSRVPALTGIIDESRKLSSSSSQQRIASASNPFLQSGSRLKKRHYTGRLHLSIEKRRSVPVRSFANSVKTSNGASTDKAAKDRVTWREALKSPRKAAVYSLQLWRGFVSWCKHMWAGVKLLAADVRVSSKVLKKITHGKQISRRERNFIVKTGVDLARLVPFSLFLIVPLAEFALPFALRLFPNMLPSQFQDQIQAEENLKKRLKGRLEIAKYLRDVVEEKAKTIKASDVNSELKKDAEDLTDFLDAIRSGKHVDATQVARFARFFNDELTIDGAVRPQLVAMCKYMGLSPYGHDSFLRFKLRSRLNAIQKDDMEIMWEGGPGSLTDDEVSKACRDRGIKEETSAQRMRQQLRDWLELSQDKEIPGSLLIMSRAFLYTTPEGVVEPGSDNLVETLGSLPDDVIMDVKRAADVSDENNVERLAETLRQAKLIEIEADREAQKEKEDEEKRRKKEAEEEVEKLESEEQSAAQADSPPDDAISDGEIRRRVELHEAQLAEQVIGSSARSGQSTSTSEEEGAEAKPHDEPETRDEEEVQKEKDGIRKMLLSFEELSSDSAVDREREELRNLKLELAEAEVEVKGTEGEASADMRRFKKLVTKLEREIERVDAKVGLRMKLLDKDNDGLMSLEECKGVMAMIAGDRDDDLVSQTLERLDADADGNISKQDLARVLREMQFDHGTTEEATPTNANNSTIIGESQLKEAN